MRSWASSSVLRGAVRRCCAPAAFQAHCWNGRLVLLRALRRATGPHCADQTVRPWIALAERTRTHSAQASSTPPARDRPRRSAERQTPLGPCLPRLSNDEMAVQAHCQLENQRLFEQDGCVSINEQVVLFVHLCIHRIAPPAFCSRRRNSI